MSTVSENDKSNMLKQVIFSLSKEQNIFEDSKELEKYCIELEKIYSSSNEKKAFRHNYSDIFGWLAQIDRDISGESGNLEILALNINHIKSFYNRWKQHGIGEEDVHKQIGKLYDHINLEVARIHYLEAIYDDRENKMQDINQQIASLEIQTKEEIQKAEDIKKKVNNAYSEFVSILGIFSAIVMVFFGGASIFGNVFSALKKVSIYKSVIVCAIAGMIIADIIFIFLLFLSKLLDRSIAAKTYEWEVYSNPIKRFRIRYPAIFYFNVLAALIVAITAGIWNIGRIRINKNIAIGIIKYVSNILEIDLLKSTLLIISTGIWIIVNLLFVMAYIFAKITDINIGKFVHIKAPLFLYIVRSDEKNYLYAGNYPEDELLKESNSLSKIIFYEKIYKIRNGISIKLVDCLEKCLIYGHIRRFAD